MRRLVLRILSPPSALYFCLFTGIGAPLLPGAAQQGILVSSDLKPQTRRLESSENDRMRPLQTEEGPEPPFTPVKLEITQRF